MAATTAAATMLALWCLSCSVTMGMGTGDEAMGRLCIPILLQPPRKCSMSIK